MKASVGAFLAMENDGVCQGLGQLQPKTHAVLLPWLNAAKEARKRNLVVPIEFDRLTRVAWDKRVVRDAAAMVRRIYGIDEAVGTQLIKGELTDEAGQLLWQIRLFEPLLKFAFRLQRR